MDARTKEGWSLLLVAALMTQSLGCGTILYPERRGQRGGRVDAGVAVLDGIGLLFFIIPGVIAFAVDFGNGAIYLPGTMHARSEIREYRFEPKGDKKAAVERIVLEKTGLIIDLDRKDAQIVELKSTDELPARFAQIAMKAT